MLWPPPIHHVGYVVEDLRSGTEAFTRQFGAGPFFGMEHMVFDEVTYRDGPAVYDHSSAFGAWGSILVELTQVHDAQPPEFREALVAPGAGIGHIGFVVPSLSEETERLEAIGLVAFHTGKTGPASAVWFEGGPLFGHPIEVLQERDQILGFYAMVRAAAIDWDGSEPLRIMTGPPA
jgi:hypothetical protein